jgi:hypothetical protein
MLAIDIVVKCVFLAVGVIGLLGLALLYRDYRVDKLRDDLFSLRDELFDYAVSEQLIDNPGYRRLRNIINSTIQFAHKISFLGLLSYMLLEKLIPEKERRIDPVEEWLRSIDVLPEKQKQHLIRVHLDMFVLIIQFMADVSLLLRLILGMVYVRVTIEKMKETAVNVVIRKSQRGLKLIEAQALDEAV